MHALLKQPLAFVTFAVFSALPVGTASAQATRVAAEAPTFDDLPSPEFAGVKNKAFRPKDWLEVEAKIKLEAKPEPPSKMLDRVTVKWFVAVKNPEKAGTFLLLTKDVEHVNVPLGEDVYVSVYLSPGSIRKITGSDRAGKNAIDLVGYEVHVNGEKSINGEATNKSQVGWWATASDKIARSEAVPLLSKAETPFSNMWWDRYAEVLVERR